MMHYGFCRKHADQTGEGGCPECAMDHQQSTILAMTETAKESSRIHIEMHNQVVALQAEVARLQSEIQLITAPVEAGGGVNAALRTRIADLEAAGRELIRTQDEAIRIASVRASQESGRIAGNVQLRLAERNP